MKYHYIYARIIGAVVLWMVVVESACEIFSCADPFSILWFLAESLTSKYYRLPMAALPPLDVTKDRRQPSESH